MSWGPYHTLLNIFEPLVVLDLETTGLSPASDAIIEVAAIKVSPGSNRHPAYQALVRCGRRLPARIQRMTGLREADFDERGVDPHIALSGLADFIGDLPIVAFNAQFDVGFLNAGFRAHGVPVVKKGHSCALRLARVVWPGMPNYRLTSLAEHHGLASTNAHRALDDALRCAHIYYRAAGLNTRDPE